MTDLPSPRPCRTCAIVLLGVCTVSVADAAVVHLLGAPAPALQLASSPNDARPPALDAFRGRAVLLTFWATTSRECDSALPRLQSLRRTFADRGLMTLAVTREPRSAVAHFTRVRLKTAVPFAVANDDNGRTHRAYGVHRVPETYLIDSAGRVAWHGRPADLDDEHVVEVLKTTAGALAEAARAANPSVRGLAAFRLGRYRSPGARAVLQGLLDDHDPLVRSRAAVALAALGERLDSCLPLMRSATRDRRAEVRAAAVGCLGQTRRSADAPVLAAALKDEVVYVRRAAARALGRVGGSQAVPALGEALHDRDPATARAAALSLAELRSPLAAALLRTAATNAQHPAGAWIAAAMHRMGAPDSLARLGEFLGHEDVFLRRQALAALTQLDGLDATELYVRALNDPDDQVRQTAMAALANTDTPQARTALRNRVHELLSKCSSGNAFTRGRANRLAAHLGPAAAPFLFDQIARVSDAGRQDLAITVGRLGNPEVIQEAAARLETPDLSPSLRAAYEAVLAGMPTQARDAVYHLLHCQDAPARESAVRLLAGYNDREATLALQEDLADEAVKVRIHAASVLARRYDESALPVLLAAAREQDLALRELAVESLGYFTSADTTRAIVEAAGNEKTVLVAAVSALDRQRTPDAIAALEELAGHSDREISTRAKAVLRSSKASPGVRP